VAVGRKKSVNILKILCAVAPFLAACHGGSGGGNGGGASNGLPPLGPVTVPNPMAFLVSPSRTVRFDFGRYQATTSYQLDDTHAVTTWDYQPLGVYNPDDGDGGEQYAVEGDTVRIEGTRDGGKPYNQYFVGKACGGTGWLVFRTDASDQWREMIAKLDISQDPNSCSAGSLALTRYRKARVSFPELGEQEAIISEHYSSDSVDRSDGMERSFFVQGYGRVAWQAFSSHGDNASSLDKRCSDFGWSQSVGSMSIADCRISVQVVGDAAGDLWRLGR
jgi:hypothetical protein